MVRRDSKGRFLPKSHTKTRRRGGSKTRSPRRRHAVTGYTQHRAGKTVRVHRHMNAEPRRRRRCGKRRAPRGGGRPVIVVANSPRRRGRGVHVTKAPPLFTMGGMVFFGLGGIIGSEVADTAARWQRGILPPQAGAPAPNLPAGVSSVQQYNENAQAVPTGMSIAWKLGISFVGFLAGALVPWPLAKLFFYGWGFGAAFNAGTDIIDTYLIAPMFVTNGQLSARGQQLYQHEYNAKQLIAPSSTPTASATTTTTTTGGTTTTTTPATPTGGTTPQPTAGTTTSGTTQSGTGGTAPPSTTGAPPAFSHMGTPIAASAPALPAGRPAGHVPTMLSTVGAAPADLFSQLGFRGPIDLGYTGIPGAGQPRNNGVPPVGNGGPSPVPGGGSYGPTPQPTPTGNGGGGYVGPGPQPMPPQPQPPPGPGFGPPSQTQAQPVSAGACCSSCASGNPCQCQAGDPPSESYSPMFTSLIFGRPAPARRLTAVRRRAA